MANKKGERFSSCLTPVKQGKYNGILVLVLILDLIVCYMFLLDSGTYHRYYTMSFTAIDHHAIQYQMPA